MRVGIIGGGIMGSCSALELARRGHDATVFEQFDLKHEKGSAGGRSRIIRQAYVDSFYTAILTSGYPMWREMEQESGSSFVHECGLLYYGKETASDVRMCREGLEMLSVPHEVLSPAEISDRWQAPGLKESETGIFTPEAGWVQTKEALEAAQSLAKKHGAQFVHQKIESLTELADFDRVIVAAGAWVRQFTRHYAPTITLQTFAYVRGEYHGPVWIESGPHFLYGFPNEPGSDSFKIGVHFPGRRIDPESDDRKPDTWAIEIIADAARRRMGVASAHVTEASACLYTKEDSEDFRIYWEDKRTLIASPCSGHGFKFGPWMGHFLADVLEGRESLDNWPRFHP